MKVLRIIFLIVSFLVFVLALFNLKVPNCDILQAFISANSIKSKEYISKLASLSSNQINIIFESDSEENLDELKTLFFENFSSSSFKIPDELNEVIEIYKKYPRNFLSEDYRNLIKNKDYKTLNKKSFEMLYNPLGFYILPVDKDPYLLVTDYVLKNISSLDFMEQNDIKEKDGKFYFLSRYEIKEKNDVKNIIDTAEKINKEISKDTNEHIYLTGTSIHSYYSAKRSSIEINTICLIAITAFVLICYHYFKTVKILLPIALSISFGLLSGFSVAVIIFKQLHVLTFVFSTSLIGISLDYALHYYISKKDKNFKKSLLMSLLTTVLAFLTLYFSNIEVLKQICVFTVFGLIGVYLFVILYLPLFKIGHIEHIKPDFNRVLLKKHSKLIIILILIVILSGSFNLKFSDSLKSLYQPKNELLRAEKIYRDIFNVVKTGFILVQGESTDEILEKEEKIKEDSNNNYIALSNYVSSKKKQKENILLINKLYQENLNSYADFLDKKTVFELLNNGVPEIYDVEKFPLNEKFKINDNETFMIVKNPSQDIKTLDIQKDMEEILKTFRYSFLKLIPFIFIGIYLILAFFLKPKKALRAALPSFLGGCFSLCVLSLFNIEITVFHIIAFVLTLGFSLDYSIFRVNGSKNSNLAVFISMISSVISFTLLAFADFKVISSLGTVLSLGIFSSYILGLLLISPENENI